MFYSPFPLFLSYTMNYTMDDDFMTEKRKRRLVPDDGGGTVYIGALA